MQFEKAFNQIFVLLTVVAITVMLMQEKNYCESKDGIELVWATNHFGPFLLTMLLLGIVNDF
jgi:NAD(P)-dependent dehydrogenase (short-subunit alcohol dehydrogenase family)